MLLSRPKPPHALSIELDDPEADVALVEHDDLVLMGAVVNDMPEGQQRRGTRENGLPPSRVTCN